MSKPKQDLMHDDGHVDFVRAEGFDFVGSEAAEPLSTAEPWPMWKVIPAYVGALMLSAAALYIWVRWGNPLWLG